MVDNIQDAPTIHDELEQTKKKLNFEYKTKVYIVIEDSDTEDYGLVKDTLSDINWVSGQGETIGTWTRSPMDHLIHISLLPSMEALYDKSVKLWTEMVERRKTQKAQKDAKRRIPRIGPSQPKTKKEPELTEADESLLAINSMKAKLMGLRK